MTPNDTDFFENLFGDMPEEAFQSSNNLSEEVDPEQAAVRSVEMNVVAAPASTQRIPRYNTAMPGQPQPTSFNKPQINLNDGKRRYILRQRQVDKFTVKRTREELTPSMCTKFGCNFDAAKANGYPEGWSTVPQRLHNDLIEVLSEHDKQFHTLADDFIVEESALPTNWLGSNKQF